MVEAASENEEVKRKIFTALRSFLKPDAIVASNTSSISITRLASVTANPERFIGMHFMNPVPRMQLVELIRGIATKDDTFEAAKAFVTRLGKTATMSEDFPAFIVNRILLPMINEAVYTLYEGVGSVEAIDTAMRLGANHPMGPLQLADFIGLDTCLAVMQVLHDGSGGFEIPSLPAAGEIRRGRLARPQDPARLLRLPRRAPGADALTGEPRPQLSRSERLLALLQALRRRRRPVSGRVLADDLGISLRTLYRDIASLQGQGAEIEGEAGLGYVLKPGFWLPPLMLSDEEIEALVLGARWVGARTDEKLALAARDAIAKISAVLPPRVRDDIEASTLIVAPSKALSAASPDLAPIRAAIRSECKLALVYRDAQGASTERTIWPFGVGYFDEARVVMAWCELRQGFRHFRADRIASCRALEARYPLGRRHLLKDWRLSEGVAPPE